MFFYLNFLLTFGFTGKHEAAKGLGSARTKRDGPPGSRQVSYRWQPPGVQVSVRFNLGLGRILVN